MGGNTSFIRPIATLGGKGRQKRGDLTLSLLCVGGASDFRQGAMSECVSECGAGLVLSLAKDGGADAYDRGARLYG